MIPMLRTNQSSAAAVRSLRLAHTLGQDQRDATLDSSPRRNAAGAALPRPDTR